MTKIYCNYCGKMHKETDMECKKCGKSLNPKNELWKEYLYNHIKDELKDKVTDNILSLIKNFIISHLYGSIMSVLIIATTITGTIAYFDKFPNYIKNVSIKPDTLYETITTNNKTSEPIKDQDLVAYMQEYAKNKENLINENNINKIGYLTMFIADLDFDGEEEGYILNTDYTNSYISIVKKENNIYKIIKSNQFDDLSYLNNENISIYLFAKKEEDKVYLFVEKKILTTEYDYSGIDQYIFNEPYENSIWYHNLQLPEENDKLIQAHNLTGSNPNVSVYEQNKDKVTLIFSKEYHNGNIYKNYITAKDFGIAF